MFYPMRADLDKIAPKKEIATTEFLKGTIGFSGGGSNCIDCTPEFKYNTKGTLFAHPCTPGLVLRGIPYEHHYDNSPMQEAKSTLVVKLVVSAATIIVWPAENVHSAYIKVVIIKIKPNRYNIWLYSISSWFSEGYLTLKQTSY